MPNWVYNSLVVSGDKLELDKLKEQLNKPVTKNFPDTHYDKELSEWVDTPAIQHFSNPVFSFWNVVAPTDLDAYYGKETIKVSLDNFQETFSNALANDQSWYYWNVRNWGTKWDVAVADGVEYADTTLEITDDGTLMYHFQTAWSPVHEIFEKLSEQYPKLTFDYEYEEEQGWGGSAVWGNAELLLQEEYDIPSSHADYQKRDRECYCETENDPEYWYSDCPVDTEKFEYVNGWIEKESV